MSEPEEAAQKAVDATEEGPEKVKQVVEKEVRKALHKHPAELTTPSTFRQRATTQTAALLGSWGFTLSFLAVELAIYPVLNHYVFQFDPQLTLDTYVISVLAIFIANVIVMSQNLSSLRDSALAHNAYTQISEIDDLQRSQMDILSQLHLMVGEIHDLRTAVNDHVMEEL